MRRSFLSISAVLLFLIVLSQMVSFLLKNSEGRHLSFESRQEGLVTVELVVNKQEQGIYSVAESHTVEAFLFQLNPDWGKGQKTFVANGMSIRMEEDHVTVLAEMAPHKKLALCVPIDVNQLCLGEIMLIPGMGRRQHRPFIPTYETMVVA